jgi:hypothetical protein
MMAVRLYGEVVKGKKRNGSIVGENERRMTLGE